VRVKRIYRAGPPFAESTAARHATGKRIVVYTGGMPPHPWTVYVADAVHADLADAVGALG